jgi:hypothetical protein
LLVFLVLGGASAAGIWAVYSMNKKPVVAVAPLDQQGGGALPNLPPFRPGPGGGLPPGGPGIPPAIPPGQQPQKPDAGGPGGSGTEVGQLAKEIEGEDIDGKRFKLSDYRGKVVLLDFWGNW